MHPWRALRAARHLDVYWSNLGPDGPHGTIEGCRITLTTGLTQVERRCALMHELVHHERGFTGHDEHEELAVEREVAHRLIPLQGLIRVAKLGLSLHDAAEELWVREDLLTTRITSITRPVERQLWLVAVEEIAADSGC